jgi:hypothetical protein
MKGIAHGEIACRATSQGENPGLSLLIYLLYGNGDYKLNLLLIT